MFRSSKSKDLRLAMVLVIRDEARFIQAHLAYHLTHGIDRCYLYLHECVDESRSISSKFPQVKSFKLQGAPNKKQNYISEIHRLCMDHALTQARKEGIDWLLIIDADEFAVSDSLPEPFHDNGKKQQGFDKTNLKSLFKDIPEWAVQVRLKTYELMPTMSGLGQPFYENDAFVHPENYSRTIFDACDGKSYPWKGYLGHCQGQSFVRVSAPVRAYDSHRWTVMQSTDKNACPDYIPLPTIDRGWHTHHYVASPGHWHEKYAKHNHFPMHWPGVKAIPLEKPVEIWRRCVASWQNNEKNSEDYCRKHVFISDNALNKAIDKKQLCRRPELSNRIKASLTAQKTSLLQPVLTLLKPTPTLDFKELGEAPSYSKTQEVFDFSPTLLEDKSISGFCNVETYENQPFRWAEPLSVIRGSLPPGHYELSIDALEHLKPLLSPNRIEVEFNGTRTPLYEHDKSLGCSPVSVSTHEPFSLKINSPDINYGDDTKHRRALPCTSLKFKKIRQIGNYVVNLSPHRITDDRIKGFNDLEFMNGTPFKWSQTNAEVRHHIVPGKYKIYIDFLDGPSALIKYDEIQIKVNGENAEFNVKQGGGILISTTMQEDNFKLSISAPQLYKDQSAMNGRSLPWTGLFLHKINKR